MSAGKGASALVLAQLLGPVALRAAVGSDKSTPLFPTYADPAQFYRTAGCLFEELASAGHFSLYGDEPAVALRVAVTAPDAAITVVVTEIGAKTDLDGSARDCDASLVVPAYALNLVLRRELTVGELIGLPTANLSGKAFALRALAHAPFVGAGRYEELLTQAGCEELLKCEVMRPEMTPAEWSAQMEMSTTSPAGITRS